MKIMVNVKQLGKRIQSVKPVEFELDCVPHTTAELIKSAVRTCVREYNERIRKSEAGVPVDAETEEALAKAGKIAFGLPFSDKEADIDEAVETAIQGYRDGLYRVFLGEDELDDENMEINLTEQSEATFIRLAMLAGRMW